MAPLPPALSHLLKLKTKQAARQAAVSKNRTGMRERTSFFDLTWLRRWPMMGVVNDSSFSF
jgi:hypothetical protein